MGLRKQISKPAILWVCISLIFISIAAWTKVDMYVTLKSVNLSGKSTTSSDSKTTNDKYITVEELLSNRDKYNNQSVYVTGYLCTELATNMGIGWLTDTKFTDKDETNILIRLESNEPFTFTPKALVAHGIFNYTIDENDLYDFKLIGTKLYSYAGTDKNKLKTNQLLDNEVLVSVMSALDYSDKTTEGLYETFTVLIDIAKSYEDEALAETLNNIFNLARQKEELSQEPFETEAEQLYNKFIALYLDTH